MILLDFEIIERIWICQMRQNLPNPMHRKQPTEQTP